MDREQLERERMLMRRARRAVVIGVFSLAMLSASALVVTASSTRRAEAACNGSSPKIISRYNASGTLVARESAPYPGSTCNGNSAYSGLLLDPVTDGSCAYAYYLEPLAYYAQQAISCTTGSWVSYGYTDTIGTNSVFVSVRPSYLSDIWETSYGY